MRVAISQPTYLPWMGYFGMMDTVDAFVFYDDVQFEKSSWQQRNKVKLPDGSANWLSVPTIRENLNSNINEIKIKNFPDWKKKHWLTLCQAYLKTPFFKEYCSEFQVIYEKNWDNLSDLNIEIIVKLSKMLKIKEPVIIKSSNLKGLEGKKTDRVLSVLSSLKADEYISTEGTKVYLETDKFIRKGIKLYWYEFKHPVYPQINGEFVPYLSTVDLLFNTGEGSLDYIREGLKNSLILA